MSAIKFWFTRHWSLVQYALLGKIRKKKITLAHYMFLVRMKSGNVAVMTRNRQGP